MKTQKSSLANKLVKPILNLMTKFFSVLRLMLVFWRSLRNVFDLWGGDALYRYDKVGGVEM